MGLIDGLWNDASSVLSKIGSDQQGRLVTAISVVDEVWDRKIFDHAKLFGGPEVGDARTLTAAVLIRLLDVEYAALASAAGGSLPPTGNATLDEVLAQACHFAYEQFSEVPLRGEKRHDSRNAQSLLFRKKNAPSFGLLLRAYQEGHGD
ncbi:MAG: hypothetical protein V2I67_19685 [Thermoanaerobaculales bacterium]|nr:hypothetical protein [Thermoanaerobaculales bacterium]